jgi:hypothetical protein
MLTLEVGIRAAEVVFLGRETLEASKVADEWVRASTFFGDIILMVQILMLEYPTSGDTTRFHLQ